MKKIRISSAIAIVATSVLIGGCAAQVVTTGNSTDARCVVIQYSGGKEIGRWNLNGHPETASQGWTGFKSGDTTIVIRGDVRVLYLP